MDATAADDRSIEHAIERVRAGDVQAFEPVLRRYEGQLRGWLACRCPPELEPDELAHLVFIAAFRNLAQYRAGSNFAAWLFAIARNQLLGELTRLARLRDYRSRHLPQAMYEALARQVADDEAGEDRRVGAMAICLDQLEEPSRRLIDLHYRNQKPLRAIADELGRSLQAVKKALFVIRRKLHECITRKLTAPEG